MLDEVDVSFSSGAAGSNYMGWRNAHVARQLIVDNTGIRDNRPFYVNVRTTGKNNAAFTMSLGPLAMAHVPPSKGAVTCARDLAGDWTVTAANFNTGSNVYVYHVLITQAASTLFSLSNQACDKPSCRFAIPGSSLAAVTSFSAIVHACNPLGVCTDATSSVYQVPAHGGAARVEHVWEASNALQSRLQAHCEQVGPTDNTCPQLPSQMMRSICLRTQPQYMSTSKLLLATATRWLWWLPMLISALLLPGPK